MGQIKTWCPRCDQGWVVEVYIEPLEQIAYFCDECEALWFDGNNITQASFVDYSTFMEERGFSNVYDKLRFSNPDSAHITVDLNAEQLRLLIGALRETLEALDPWEFAARMGFTRQEVVSMMKRLRESQRTIE